MNSRITLPLTEKENTQALPVQSRNLDLVPLPSQANNTSVTFSSNSMEIEAIYGGMMKQIKDLGTFCKGNWTAISDKICEIESRNITVEEAVSDLVRKDIETTKIVNEQISIIESAAQAFNWLKVNLEEIRQGNLNLKKVEEWFNTHVLGFNDLNRILNDVRQLNIAKELTEDKFTKINGVCDNLQSCYANIKNQVGTMSSRSVERKKYPYH